MAAMPPAMREKMEQMMGGGASAVTVTKGGSRQVAGYACQDYTIAIGETMTTKLCATTALAFPAPNVDYRKFASFAGSAGAIGNAMAAPPTRRPRTRSLPGSRLSALRRPMMPRRAGLRL